MQERGPRPQPPFVGSDEAAVVPVDDRLDVIAEVRLGAVLAGVTDEGGEFDPLVAGHVGLIAARRRSRWHTIRIDAAAKPRIRLRGGGRQYFVMGRREKRRGAASAVLARTKLARKAFATPDAQSSRTSCGELCFEEAHTPPFGPSEVRHSADDMAGRTMDDDRLDRLGLGVLLVVDRCEASTLLELLLGQLESCGRGLRPAANAARRASAAASSRDMSGQWVETR